MSRVADQVFVGRCLLLTMGLLGLSLAVAGAQETESRKYALLVGVRNYDENQLRSLPYPENDVVELGDVLKKSGFRRVVLLSQTEGAKTQRFLPLAKNVRTALAGILEDRTKDDLVLVAFAGHGVQFKGEKESYFCPMDAALTDRSSLVSLSDVYKLLAQSNAGTKLLLVDACRNDPLAGNARDVGDVRVESVTAPQRVEPPGGVAVFFSCSAGQRAFENEKLKHGVFFHHVILGLKGEAKLKRKDEVTWDSLVAHVKAEVPDTVKELFGDQYRQVPDHRGELRGNATLMSFVKPASSIPSVPDAGSVQDTANLPKEITSKSTGMKLTLIPAGTFTMGSPASETDRRTDEGPAHTVRISQPFYMGVYEVTQAEYENVMGTNTSYFSTGRGGVFGMNTSKFPVDSVSWDDAQDFCKKLSVKDGVTYRLPTEAEWEYACRAVTTTPFHFGSTLIGDKANVDGNYPYGTTAKGTYLNRTTTVGSYAKNAFGLFDMHGNVFEWCEDVYDGKAYASRSGITTDPKVTNSSTDRVLRGGSWVNFSGSARAAYRHRFTPGNRYHLNGFRVAR